MVKGIKEMKKTIIFIITVITINGFVTAQNLPVVIEAEDSELGSDFEIVEESGVQFVKPSTDYLNTSCPGDASKVITFSVPFVETGNYEVYVKVKVGDENYNDDSFFLSMEFGNTSPTNSDEWYIVNGIVTVGHTDSDEVVTGEGNASTQTWKWINISEYLSSESSVEYSVENTDESLVFCIGAREDGLYIDKIAFGKADFYYTVNNLDYVEAGSKTVSDSSVFADEAYQTVKTFVNPVLPGDHPDLTLFKDSSDFYACGSCFHFTPYLPILHSTDLVHWEEICRVVTSDWSDLISDEPQAGIWQGAITRFYNSYWIYFSNTAGGGQYFSKADNPAGTWSAPVKVNTTSSTGATGYDNSIFVDDDGTPYMLIKPGQYINRIQEIGQDGHLTGEVINMDWVNKDGQYSWAEGPVMCKHNGWYYYFIAGNVSGGQYVLRSDTLSDDTDSWEALGDFFAGITDDEVTFRSPNHISQPFQLEDSTWWVLSHSYESLGSDDWSGQGRQGLLHEVIWDEDGKPTGKAPTSTPQLKPELPKSGIAWKTPRSDSFDDETIKLSWHFLNTETASRYSLTENPGWLTLSPGTETCHILHKEARHYYSIITKLNIDATTNGQEAGIYLTNGNESITASVYSGYNDGKKIGFRFNTETVEEENNPGNTLWLKMERYAHQLKGFYSSDGISWHQIGEAVSSVNLDESQTNYNWWVGTSNGLYACQSEATFDYYAFKDGFSELPVIGYNNYFGLETQGTGINTAMTNSTGKGGWVMLGGVDLGRDERIPATVEVEAASIQGGQLEIWIDDLENEGLNIATINITSTGSETTWEKFSTSVSDLSGQHDIYLRWSGDANAFLVKNIQFTPDDSYITGINTTRNEKSWKVYPNPFFDGITLETGNDQGNYSILSLEGKLIESGRIKSAKQVICKNIKPGMYLLKITTGEKCEVIKINKIK